MTLALAPATRVAREREAADSPTRRTTAEHVAVAALLLWWALPLTRGSGGRDLHLLSVGLLTVLAASLAVRPWQSVPRREQLLTAIVAATAFAVCLVAPTGWAGANEAATWTYACGTYLCVRAYAVTDARRHALVAALAAAGAAEFAMAWLPWWGNADSSRPMIGTFYWHNEYAAYLVVPALAAASLAVWPRRQTRLLGWLAAPLCSAGVLFSTSRTTLGLLVLGWLVVLAAAASSPSWRSALPRAVALGLLTVVTSFALTGPPFFAHRASPSSGVAAREDQEAATGNLAWRTKMWREAAVVYSQHPVAGVGFHGFGSAASAAMPELPHSAFAHDVWLQSFAEGGTVFGLPVLLASILGLRRVGGRVLRAARRRDQGQVLVVGAAALLLGAHSLVDFDMSYPALAAMMAVALAVAMPPASDPDPAAERPRARSWLVALPAVVLALAAVVSVPAAWNGITHFNVKVAGGVSVPGSGR